MMALIMHCRKAYKISPLLHWVKIQLRVYPALVNNYHKFIYVEWWGPCCSLFWIFYVVFCARWCLFLWIVHSWLSFPFSLKFIFYWKYAAAMYVYSIQIITRNNTCIYAFILYNINTISFFYILLKWYVDWLQPSSPLFPSDTAYLWDPCWSLLRCRSGRFRIVVWFSTTDAINAYHHWRCEFNSRLWRGLLIQRYVKRLAAGRWFSPGTYGFLHQ